MTREGGRSLGVVEPVGHPNPVAGSSEFVRAGGKGARRVPAIVALCSIAWYYHAAQIGFLFLGDLWPIISLNDASAHIVR